MAETTVLPEVQSAPPHAVHRLWPWMAALSSGMLMVLCFPPFNQGGLAWIALTPLICALWFGKSPRPFLLGYLTGFVFFTGTFYWLSALAGLFATPWLRGLPPLLALYLALYPALWAWIVARVISDQHAAVGKTGLPRFSSTARNFSTALIGASAWAGLEWIRGWLFSGFGWNAMGVALHRDLPMIQIVDMTGVPGLSFLVVWCNLMAVVVVRRLTAEFGPQFLRHIRWEFTLTMALVAAVFSYGVKSLLGAQPKTVPLSVAAIQPNIPQTQKFDPEAEEAIFGELDRLMGLASLLQPTPQLVVWPESAIPRGMFADNTNFDFVMRQAGRGDFSLLLGSLDYEFDEKDPTQARVYNAALLLSEKGEVRSSYRKMHLVPFGEFLPLRPILPAAVEALVPGDLDAGSEPTVLSMPHPAVRIGALVCFEDTLGDLTRRFPANGAQLLVNITNDGWFGQTAAAEQHLANAVFRAVENRRPLLRCANTGVTCSVDLHGRVTRWLDPFVQGFDRRTLQVPVDAPLTFYTRRGDWFAQAATLITLFAMVRCGARAWNRRKGGATSSPRP